MTWVVTLKVVSCASPSTLLSGATIADGYHYYYTDVNGQFIAIVDSAYTGYVIQISKSGYSPLTYALSSTQNGTIQTVCLNTAPPPDQTTTNGGLSCFIVTAATGSAESDEVTELRTLRDRVGAAAPLARRLIEAVYGEYERFSPAIAQRIEDDSTAKFGVLALVVRPLLSWYRLAALLALEPDSREAIEQAEREVRSACPRYLGPSHIASLLSRVERREALPDSAPALARELAPQLAQASALPLARWAILQPLVMTWNGVAERLDLKHEIGVWLSRAPFEHFAPPQDADAEIAALSRLLAFDTGARRALGERLLHSWPNAADALYGRMLEDAN